MAEVYICCLSLVKSRLPTWLHPEKLRCEDKGTSVAEILIAPPRAHENICTFSVFRQTCTLSGVHFTSGS